MPYFIVINVLGFGFVFFIKSAKDDLQSLSRITLNFKIVSDQNLIENSMAIEDVNVSKQTHLHEKIGVGESTKS